MPRAFNLKNRQQSNIKMKKFVLYKKDSIILFFLFISNFIKNNVALLL